MERVPKDVGNITKQLNLLEFIIKDPPKHDIINQLTPKFLSEQQQNMEDKIT